LKFLKIIVKEKDKSEDILGAIPKATILKIQLGPISACRICSYYKEMIEVQYPAKSRTLYDRGYTEAAQRLRRRSGFPGILAVEDHH